MVEVARPSGTVTFLFTDVERSTVLWNERPEAMRLALARHDAILRRSIEAGGGYVFSRAGDAFSAAFDRAADAVEVGVAAQELLAVEPWPDGVTLRVRMGLHTGEAEERDGDYFGVAVNRAARVMSAGHGGQILLSEVTAGVADRRDLVDMGEVSLEGFSGSERLFQVGDQDFGDLLRAVIPRGSVPVFETVFVGRGPLVAQLREELAESGLVTVLGPGGIGKTRLAVEATSGVADRWAGGVWVCELADVTDDAAVAAAVAATLDVRLQSGLSAIESIVDAAAGTDLLVVLDNCEHVLDAAAEVAAALRSVGVPVLATSRELLGVQGERVLPVDPLERDEAVTLFVERARQADLGFALGAEQVPVVGELCDRLDGSPLAIELAAARTRSMTVADIADRLDDRFRLLRPSRRQSQGRQATLEATVQWSYDLLDPAERALFDRLSVFAGGFDLAAAEAICCDELVDRADVVDLLASLVDKSMVTADRSSISVWFSQLETFRQVGQRHLEEEGTVRHWRDAHLAYVVHLAVDTGQLWEGARYLEAVSTFETQWANIRSALEHAQLIGDIGSAEQILLAVSLHAFYSVVDEVQLWSEAVSLHPQVTSVGLAVASMMSSLVGDHSRALELGERAIAEAGPDDPALPRAYLGVQLALTYSGRTYERDLVNMAWLELAERTRDPMGLAFHCAAWQLVHTSYGETDKALLWSLRRDELVLSLDHPPTASFDAVAHGLVLNSIGRLDEAEDQFRIARKLTSESGLKNVGTMLPTQEATAWKARGEDERCFQALRRGFKDIVQARNWINAWSMAEFLAYVWFRYGLTTIALPVLGYLRAHGYASAGIASERAELADQISAVVDGERLLHEGATMTRAEITQFIFDGIEQHPTLPAQTAGGA